MAWTTKFSGLPTLTDIIHAEDSYASGVFTMNPGFIARSLSDGPIAYVSLSAIGADTSQVLRVTGRLTAFNFFFESWNLGGGALFYTSGSPRTGIAFTNIMVDDAMILPGSAGTWSSNGGSSADSSLTAPPWLFRCYRNGTGSAYVIPDAGFGSWSIAAGQQSHWYSDDDGTTWVRLGDIANVGTPDRAGIVALWSLVGAFSASGVVYSNLEVMQDGAGPPPVSRQSDETATAADSGTVLLKSTAVSHRSDEVVNAQDWATPWQTSYNSKVLAGINKGGTNGAVLQRNSSTTVWDEIQDFAGASNLTVYDVQQLNGDYAAACIPNDSTGATGFFWVFEGGSWVDKSSLLPTYTSPHSLFVAGVDDIWIGGYRAESGNSGEAIWRYDGVSVTQKYLSTISSTAKGDSIDGVDTNLIYLAGQRVGFGSGRLTRITGGSTVTQWNLPGTTTDCYSISVLDGSNIYIGGRHGLGYNGVYHFDGSSTFTDLGNPGGGSTQVTITGLWARSTSEVWAAGYFNSGGTGAGIWLWNGASWSIQQNLTWSGAQGRSATGLKGTGEAWFGVYGTTTQRALYWNGATFTQETFATGSDIRKMSAIQVPASQNRSIRENETITADDSGSWAEKRSSYFLVGGRYTTDVSRRQISFRKRDGSFVNILNVDKPAGQVVSSIRRKNGVLYACGSNYSGTTAYGGANFIIKSTSLGAKWDTVKQWGHPGPDLKDVMARDDGTFWFISGHQSGYRGMMQYDPATDQTTMVHTAGDYDVGGMTWTGDDDVWYVNANTGDSYHWNGSVWRVDFICDWFTGAEDEFLYAWNSNDVIVGTDGNIGTKILTWSGASWVYFAAQPPLGTYGWGGTHWGMAAGPSINDFYLAYSTANAGYYAQWRDRISHWNGSSWTIVLDINRGTYGGSEPTIHRDPNTGEYLAAFYSRIYYSAGGDRWHQVPGSSLPNTIYSIIDTPDLPPDFFFEQHEEATAAETTDSEGPRGYERAGSEIATAAVTTDVSYPLTYGDDNDDAEGGGISDSQEFPSSAVDTPFWQTPEIPSGTALEDALGGFSDHTEQPPSAVGTDFWQTPPIPDGVVLPELVKPLGGGFSDSVFITLGSANYSADEQTTDSEGHPHLITYRPYLLYSGDISAEPWANPTTTNFTGYAADGTRYTNGVQDAGPVYAPWYSEVASDDRSSFGPFPTKYLIAISRLELVIYNLAGYPANLSVWMRFRRGETTGSSYTLLGRQAETLADAKMLNGVLIATTLENGTDRGRVHLIDFRQDTQRYANLIGSDNHWMGVSGQDITDRNLSGVWTTSGVSPSLRISPEYPYSLTAYSAADGSKYWVVVAGEDQGPDVIEVNSSGVPQLLSSATGETGGDNLGNVRQVLIDRDGWLWHSYYGKLYRNGLKYQEGVITIPSTLDPGTPMVDLGTTIWDLVDSENYIYAATDLGVHRIHRGTMEARLLWTIVGGGGVGKDNIPGSGELLIGTKPMVNQIRAYTLNGSGYVAVASKLDGGNLHGGVTLIRTNDETVLDSMEFPDLAEDGAYVGIPVGL